MSQVKFWLPKSKARSYESKTLFSLCWATSKLDAQHGQSFWVGGLDNDSYCGLAMNILHKHIFYMRYTCNITYLLNLLSSSLLSASGGHTYRSLNSKLLLHPNLNNGSAQLHDIMTRSRTKSQFTHNDKITKTGFLKKYWIYCVDHKMLAS